MAILWTIERRIPIRGLGRIEEVLPRPPEVERRQAIVASPITSSVDRPSATVVSGMPAD